MVNIDSFAELSDSIDPDTGIPLLHISEASNALMLLKNGNGLVNNKEGLQSVLNTLDSFCANMETVSRTMNEALIIEMWEIYDGFKRCFKNYRNKYTRDENIMINSVMEKLEKEVNGRRVSKGSPMKFLKFLMEYRYCMGMARVGACRDFHGNYCYDNAKLILEWENITMPRT